MLARHMVWRMANTAVNFNSWALPTLPQARQWCRRLVNVNGTSHCIHVNVSESGLHTGATLPSWVIGRLILAQSGGPTYGGGDGMSAAALSVTCCSTNWCPDNGTTSELGCAVTSHRTTYKAAVTKNSNYTRSKKTWFKNLQIMTAYCKRLRTHTHTHKHAQLVFV